MYTVFYFDFSNSLLRAVLFEITYMYVQVYTAFAFEKLSGAQFSALCTYYVIEIKGLGSRIRDMEAEWRLKLISFLGESLVSRTGAVG